MPVQSANLTSVASGDLASFYCPTGGRIVDLIVYQLTPGTGGTSVSLDIRTAASGGGSGLTTPAVVSLASGSDQKTDALGDLSLPTGWTRPVVGLAVTKGQRLFIRGVETGTYGTHPIVQLTVIIGN
jgi:hypothetical protein